MNCGLRCLPNAGFPAFGCTDGDPAAKDLEALPTGVADGDADDEVWAAVLATGFRSELMMFLFSNGGYLKCARYERTSPIA